MSRQAEDCGGEGRTRGDGLEDINDINKIVNNVDIHVDNVDIFPLDSL